MLQNVMVDDTQLVTLAYIYAMLLQCTYVLLAELVCCPRLHRGSLQNCRALLPQPACCNSGHVQLPKSAVPRVADLCLHADWG